MSETLRSGGQFGLAGDGGQSQLPRSGIVEVDDFPGGITEDRRSHSRVEEKARAPAFFLETLFCFLEPGNIPAETDAALALTPHVSGGDFDVEDTPVLPAVTGGKNRISLLLYVSQPLDRLFLALIGIDVPDTHVQKLLPTVTRTLAVGVVYVKKTPLHVYHPETVPGGPDHGLQEIELVSCSVVVPLFFRQNFGVYDNASDLSVRAVPGTALPARPVQGSVLPFIRILLAPQDLSAQSLSVSLSPFFRQVGKNFVVVFSKDVPFFYIELVEI
jgi:hypothetical protein